MRRQRLICMAAALVLSAAAGNADTVLAGRVIPGETESMLAPFGGVVRSIDLREGSLIHVGDRVAQIQTTRVMAPEDGTITGINAQEGDSADQTVLYLAPVSRYTVNASIKWAYEEAENTYVNTGERVYIRCREDGSHQAVGIVTKTDGSDYTVETTAGELYLEETVYIYRMPDYRSESRIGSGTVTRTGLREISGKGSIVRMAVEDGDEVERGQTLFETVEGSIDGLAAMKPTLTSTLEGIVAQVNVKGGATLTKGDTLLTCYPTGTLQIECDIPEESLRSAVIGKQVSIYFDSVEGRTSAKGTLEEISYVSESTENGEAVYKGYIRFEEQDGIRVGMNVSVTL